MKIKTNFYVKLILIFLVIIGFWYRYLRIKNAQEIFFVLNDKKLLFIIYILTIYMFAIYVIISNKNNSNNTFIASLANKFIYNPIRKFYDFLLTNDKFKIYTSKYLVSFTRFMFLKHNSNIFFYTIVLPRIILCLMFCVDVFYFNKIYYYYYLIFLSLLLLCNTLINLLFSFVKTENIKLTDHRASIYVYYAEEKTLIKISGEILVKLQASKILKKQKPVNYHIILAYDYLSDLYQEFNIPAKDSLEKHLNMDYFKDIVHGLIGLAVLLETINTSFNNFKERYKYIFILINIIYIFCWFYMVYINIEFLNSYLLEHWLPEISDPFSEIKE